MLILFKQRRVGITLQDYETYVDAVISVLEEVNDEKYRLDESQEGK